MTTPKNYTEEYVLANRDSLDIDTILHNNRFAERTLVQLMPYTTLRTILTTQKLSLGFVVEYILDPDHQEEDGDTTISMADIQCTQGYTPLQIKNYK